MGSFLVKNTKGHASGLYASLCTLGVLTVGLSGCGSMDRLRENPPNWLTPYRADIGQGNFITQEQASRLKAGMTREQVRALLGTPLLVDPFRDNRWDYVFDIKRGDGKRDRRRFYVAFEKDQLTKWGGDDLPEVSGDLVLPMRPAR